MTPIPVDVLSATSIIALFLASPGRGPAEPFELRDDRLASPLLLVVFLLLWTAVMIGLAVLFPETAAGMLSDLEW